MLTPYPEGSTAPASSVLEELANGLLARLPTFASTSHKAGLGNFGLGSETPSPQGPESGVELADPPWRSQVRLYPLVGADGLNGRRAWNDPLR